MMGVVRQLDPAGRFGFVEDDKTSRDLFFHSTACNGFSIDDLELGAAIESDEVPSERGPRAANVRLLGD
jgi:cold shock CspA family protein